jgi:hypothetical protein
MHANRPRKTTGSCCPSTHSFEVLREFVGKESLCVVREFVESETAKVPGRPVFNSMMEKIEQSHARGIIVATTAGTPSWSARDRSGADGIGIAERPADRHRSVHPGDSLKCTRNRAQQEMVERRRFEPACPTCGGQLRCRVRAGRAGSRPANINHVR